MGDDLAFEPAGVVEVELLQALAGRKPGGADAALTTVGLPGGDFPLQAGHQVLLMRPAFRAGAVGQPPDRVAQRRCLERAGQERDLGGEIAAGLGCGRGAHQATPPSPVLTPSAVS